MSAMKLRYERGLRPWPGQQADQSETESVTERAAPTPQRNHPHQQSLFPIRVVMCDTPESFAAFMEAELAHTKAWCQEKARLNGLRDIADSYVPKQLIILPPAADDQWIGGAE